MLHLEVGQQATAAPAGAQASAHATLDGDRRGYTDALGIPEPDRKDRDHPATTSAMTSDGSGRHDVW